MRKKFSRVKRFFKWSAIVIAFLLVTSIIAYIFFPLQTFNLIQSTVLRMDGIKSKYVAVDNYKIHYLTGGEGPTLVLLHGHPGKSAEYAPILPALAKTHRIIAIDFLGYGNSDAPHIEYSISLQTQIVKSVLKELNIENTAMLGFSTGGWVALKLAAENPEMISRLVLVDCGGLPFPNELTPEMFVAKNLEEFKKMQTYQGGIQNLPPKHLLRALIRDLQERDYAIKSMGKAILSFKESLDGKLQSVNMPVLIVWGADDKIVSPEIGLKLKAQIGNSRFELFDGCGHLLLWTCRESVMPEIQRFLD